MTANSNKVDDRITALSADPFALPPVTAHQRRGGRPRGSQRAVRAEHLGIRLLSSERIRLEAAAARAKYRDTSAWARGLLLAAADGNSLPMFGKATLSEIVKLRRDLNSGIGANLNQAMLHANQLIKSGGVPDATRLADMVQETQVALRDLHAELQSLLGPMGRT